MANRTALGRVELATYAQLASEIDHCVGLNDISVDAFKFVCFCRFHR